MENWVEINGYENYMISDRGHIRFSDSDKKVTVKKNNWGYKYVRLRKNRIVFTTSIHRLVALHFVPNPENKPQVNHINKNKNHNSYFNLEWVTIKENLSLSKIPVRKTKSYYKNYYRNTYKDKAKERYQTLKDQNPNFHNSKRGRKPSGVI